MQTIAPNKILFESTSVVEISPTNCPDGSNCSPVTLYSYNNTSNQDLHIDPYLFSWNADNTKFVTSYHADIVNINDLTKEASLKDITGKNYFQVTFSPDGNLYATVQGEKLIHVFNNNYELIDTITTKLYPLFPLITDSGLQVIGAYNAIQYSGYYYGHEFNFNNNKCAIEVF
jgi:hypothetical protein